MKTDRTIALAIFFVALAVRLIYLYENTSSPYFARPILDEVYLDGLGLRIAHGEGFGNEAFFRAPLYPLLLGAVYSINEADRFFFVALLQHLLGALVCVMAFVIAREMGRRRAGIIAGLLAAFYGPLVFYEGEVVVDSIFLFLAAAALLLLALAAGRPVRRGHLLWGGGLALGLAAITRANILPFVPVAAVWAMFLPGRQGLARRLGRAGRIILPAIILFGITAARNYMVTGEASAMPSQGGINFYCGNGPGADGKPPPTRKVCGISGQYRDKIETASVDALERAIRRPVAPTEASSAWYGITLRHINAHKAGWLKLMGKKFVLFWNDCEIKNTKNWYFCRRYSIMLMILPAGFGIVAALGLLGAWAAVARNRSPAALLPVLYVACFMATIMLFFVCDRLRLPVVVGLLPLAGCAADFLVEAWSTPPAGRARARVLTACLGVLLLFTYVDWCDARSDDYSQEYWSVGRIYYDRGEYGKALDALDKCSERDPAFAGAHLFAGHSLLQSGRCEDAIGRYRLALKADPAEVRAFNGIGVCEEKLGRPNSAMNAYRKAAELSPTYAKARTNLGILLAKQGQAVEGRDRLEEALALDKDDPEVRLGLAMCAALSGRRADRIRHLDAAVYLGGEQYREIFNKAMIEARGAAPMDK